MVWLTVWVDDDMEANVVVNPIIALRTLILEDESDENVVTEALILDDDFDICGVCIDKDILETSNSISCLVLLSSPEDPQKDQETLKPHITRLTKAAQKKVVNRDKKVST